jgi:hypothetical protein
MNTRQRIAYTSPSAEAEDTLKDRFGWYAVVDGRRFRLQLTANVGYE